MNDTSPGNPQKPFVPIAIVSMSALFPGRIGTAGFWRDIVGGADNIIDVPPSHWLIEDYYDPDPSAPDKTYCKRGGFLTPIPFDALGFGLPPNSLPATDSVQLLTLTAARELLEDGGQQRFPHVDRERIGIMLGVTSATELVGTLTNRLQRPLWLKGMRESGVPESQARAACDRIADGYVPWQESSFPGLLGNVVAGRVANRLDLGGANFVTDAACASSLSALQVALHSLQLGESDLVITGGGDTMNDIFMYMCFSKTPAFSPTGDCRPFSADADGTIIGEGLGLFALRRLADAERDGDPIYAVIRGLGASSDGRATSVYAPRPAGQARALRRAYEAAGFSPATVRLVEAHGTATKAGDAAEFAGLREVFDPAAGDQRQFCALGSVKSQIGHTKAAAGAAGLFKAAMALHHRLLPPTVKVDKPNPGLGMEESPFYLNTRARPWIGDRDHPRRAAVSSFGFGGSNFHVVMEEYRGPGRRADRIRSMPCELITLSAPTADDLATLCRSRRDETENLAATAKKSQEGFDANHPFRLALVAADTAALKQHLDRAGEHLRSNPDQPLDQPGLHYGTGAAFREKIAFLFPGQGSQYVEMGGALAMAFETALDVWDEAAALDCLREPPLTGMVFPRPVFSEAERREQERLLTTMIHAQPGIAAASLAQLALLDDLGVRPDAVAGHSFGEVTALHAAGVFCRRTALTIAHHRARRMTEAARDKDGAMVAVLDAPEKIKKSLDPWPDGLVIANDNAPEQIVLSGPVALIREVTERLERDGSSVRALNVASAFHSPLVAGGCAPFFDDLQSLTFAEPRCPVLANATAAPYPADVGQIRRQLADQLARPVRFRESIDALYDAGVRLFLEVGPGGVLTGLTKQCLRGRPHTAIALDGKGDRGPFAFLDGLGRLAGLGIALNPTALWRERPPEIIEEPSAHAIMVGGANVGKRYPPPDGAAALPAPNPDPPAPETSGPVSRTTQSRTVKNMSDANTMSASAAQTGPASADIPPTPQPASPPPGVAMGGEWLAAFESFQRHTVEAQVNFQQSMTTSHQTFLRTMESALHALGGGQAGSGVPTSMPVAAPQPVMPPVAVASQPVAMAAPPVQPMAAPPVQPMAAPPLPNMAPPPPVNPQPAAPAAVSPPPTGHSAQPAVGIDAAELLYGIIAEHTGYPVEMLKPEMELEAGLGIDSIKQVEILAALQERLPDLPELDPARLSEWATLGSIIEFLETVVEPASSPPSGGGEGGGDAVPAAEGMVADPEQLLYGIIADHTGYPVEMLKPEMELEAGLGIDSIKQVEILAALQEKVPSLPEVEPARMAEWRTLGRIIDFLRQTLGGAGSEAVSPPPKPEAPRNPSSTAGTGALAMDRFLLRLEERSGDGNSLTGLRAARKVIITPDGTGSEHGVAAALATLLVKEGIDARVSATVPGDADGLIFLAGLGGERSDGEAAALHGRAFEMAKILAPGMEERGGFLVTVQENGAFGLNGVSSERAWMAGLPGLVKTAAREWPRAGLKALDVRTDGRGADDIATMVATELLQGGQDIEVALPEPGRRLVVTSIPAPVPVRGELPLAAGDVMVVSGGARGVTPAVLAALVREKPLRLLLLGRTALEPEPADLAGVDGASLKRVLFERANAAGEALSPAAIGRRAADILARREIQNTIDELSALGAEVRYEAVDVTREGPLGRLLEEVRQSWGPVAGVIHAAGVLADKRIADKSLEQFNRVFSTKVEGLRALLSATRSDPLKLICLFSSMAAREGNPGQCDYAMANEVLNKVAQAEARNRNGHCLVKSINWGPWDGGMVDAALSAHFRRQGISLISPPAGGTFLLRELYCRQDGAVEVVAGASLAADHDG